MDNILKEILQTSIMLFVVMDVLGGIPIFIGLVKDMPRSEIRKTTNLAVLVSFFILLFFSVIGIWILGVFKTTINEFKIGGGILLLIIALDEIFNFLPRQSYVKEDIGIVPIACPLLAGPGAITVILVTLYKYSFPINYLIVLASTTIVTAIAWITLLCLEPINRVVGRKGSLILNKLMGIILTAISVNFIINGIRNSIYLK